LTPSEKGIKMQKKKINPINNVDIEMGSKTKGKTLRIDPKDEETRDEIPKKKYELSRDEVFNMQKMCNKCNCVKPPRSHHCSLCQSCVLAMDHHCPWMNNCIGLRNMKAFILFNFYVAVCTAFMTIRGANIYMDCFFDEENRKPRVKRWTKACYVIEETGWLHLTMGITAIICVIFFFFTIVMFGDNVRMVAEDTSTIDIK